MMHGRNVGKAALLTGAWLLAGTASAGGAASAQGSAPAANWQTLFDGKMLDTFRGWRSEGMPEGWHVVGGTLAKEGDVDDLVSKEQFGNFELELEWKIGKGGNSGVFYRATREYDHIYWSGPEYQLLDDANAPDGRSRLTAAAAAYGLYGPPAGVVKPFGEWNKTRIIVNGEHVEHWLNGKKVVEYDFGSPDWKAKVAASKFAKYPNYGLAKKGYIGIQGDHPGSLELRHIRIRELP
ncbi:MAG TPA: DUF1080 domain-containing protein [Steroidobacteraceae bacterium]